MKINLLQLFFLLSRFTFLGFFLQVFFIPILIADQGNAFMQTRTVNGQVISADENETLVGVNVIEKGTGNGTVTDIDGNYSLEVNEGATLVFSYVGYERKEVPVGDQSVIDVVLEQDVNQLDELVVIGYGVQRKSDLTGSVSSIRGEDLVKVPSSNPLQALQGKVTGAQVANTSGEPGSNPTVRIRGVGTLNNADPIYVVDGVILDDISFLNTNDIFSIELLKDASATAIYGSRGANGVFIITTKEGGKNIEPQISLKAEYSIQRLQNKIDLLEGREFARVVNEINPGTFNNLDAVSSVDWQDQVFEQNQPLQSYDLSVSGGGEELSYYLGGGFFNQKGIVPKSDFNRYTMKLNTSYQPKEWFNLSANITAAFVEDQNAPNVVFAAYGAWPTDTPFDEEGSFAEVRGTSNPLATIEYTNSRTQTYRLISNTFAEFYFLDGFRLKTSYQADLEFGKGRSFTPEFFVSALQQNQQANLNNQYIQDNLWIWENTLNYDKEIENHRMNFMAGITFQESNREVPSFSARNFIRENEDFWYLNATLNDSVDVNLGSGDLFETSLLSYIFRANYTFQNTYLFTGTLRIDGSSKFQEDNRFGYFPSLALGWNISNEPFFPEFGILNFLKLRGSWGIIGNEKIAWEDRFFLISNNAPAVFGFNENLVPGSTFGTPGNPDLLWEETIQTNIGLEFQMFDGQLAGDVDLYHKKTKDILVNLTPPGFLGYGSFAQVRYNAADVLNQGVEFNLSYDNDLGPFNYRVSVLGTTVDNEVLTLGATIPTDSVIREGSILGNRVSLTTPGKEIASFTGYDIIGLFENEAQVDELPSLPGQGPGDFIYRDVNNDGNITQEDNIILGSPIPDFIYGFGLQLSYEQFTLSLDIQGQLGNEIYNGKNEARFTLLNFEERVKNRWTEPGSSDFEPRVSSLAGNYPPSEYYVEDGSYLRLRTATLTYSLPETVNSAIGFRSASIYLRGTNILTFTDYSGYSPEIGGRPLAAGIDMGVYPITSVYSLGLNLSF